jgi:ubiquitin-protein ligase
MQELKQFAKEGPLNASGIGLSPDPNDKGLDDVTNLTGFVLGPEDTAYFGGFFVFGVKVPSDYPSKPPHMKILTTDAGRTRFNPNFYAGGKVCMDILNTHASNAWAPSLKLETVLVSVQSLMTADPYHNEPNFEDCDAKRNPDAACQRYAAKIAHEVIRHAICDQLEDGAAAIPALWRDIAVAHFLKHADHHVATCDRLGARFEGRTFAIERFEGPDNQAAGKFEFAKLKARLRALREQLRASRGPMPTGAASSTSGTERPQIAEVPSALPQPPAEPQPPQPQESAFTGFHGPQVAGLDDLIDAAVVDIASGERRDEYDSLMTALTLALMDEPILEPLPATLTGGAVALAAALGYVPVTTGGSAVLVLMSDRANRTAVETAHSALVQASEDC